MAAKKVAPKKAALSTAASEIDAIVTKANKDYGHGTLVRGAELKGTTLNRVTSGSLAFDIMLGGGFPVNSWCELLGEPSNGKSVMAMKAVAANMALTPGYRCLYVAAEDFMPEWAEALGMDLERTTVCQTRAMEEAYAVIEQTLEERAVDAIVIDSLSALTPTEEMQGGFGDWQVGLGARLTNKFMRKASSKQRRSLTEPDRDCLALIISQWREKVGVQWGDNRTTPYGRAKEFHYVTRVETRRDEWLTHQEQKVGFTMKARTVKNKTAPPQRVAAVDFYFEDVITVDGVIQHRAGDYDRVKEVSNIAMAYDIVQRRGAYFYYGDQQWQGKDPFLQALRDDVAFSDEIERAVLAAVNGTPAPSSKPTKRVAGRK